MSIYTDPKGSGLTEIAEIDVADSCEFDMVVLWRDENGDLWAAHDSGCSCPTPFEDHTFPTDYTPVRVAEDIEPLLTELGGRGDATSFADFRNAVREALR